jgi:hypothetical protein
MSVFPLNDDGMSVRAEETVFQHAICFNRFCHFNLYTRSYTYTRRNSTAKTCILDECTHTHGCYTLIMF